LFSVLLNPRREESRRLASLPPFGPQACVTADYFDNRKFWEELIAYFPLIRQVPHRKRLQQFFHCCVCIRCRGNIWIGGNIYAITDWKGFMKYAVEMGSGAMIYIPSLIKIGSAIQKLIGGIHRQHSDRINLLLFFVNKESRLKWSVMTEQ
jgi:hypothetical protein